VDIRSLYRDAIFPKQHLCLGLILHPYCAGHEVLLDAFDSPFLMDDLPSFEDLIEAVYICAQPYSSAKSNRIAKIGVRFWSWRTRKMDLAKEFVRFKDYISEGRAFPDEIKYKIDTEEVSFTSPSVQRLKCFLMKEIGITEEQFLNQTLAKSNADFCTLQELKGTMGGQTDTDKALWEAHRNSLKENA